MTKQQYIDSMHPQITYLSEWSEPKYDCPVCNGQMCKNNTFVLTSFPPKYKYMCNKCGVVEYLNV